MPVYDLESSTQRRATTQVCDTTPLGCQDGLIVIPGPDGPEHVACLAVCCTKPSPSMTHTAAITTAPHTAHPIWASGGPLRGSGRWSAYTDYRWECGCGNRYGDATVKDGDVNAQHVAHLAAAAGAATEVLRELGTWHASNFGAPQ